MDGSQTDQPELIRYKAMVATRQRALSLIRRDAESDRVDVGDCAVRRYLATAHGEHLGSVHGGFGYLSWRFADFHCLEGEFFAALLYLATIEYVWQACAKTRTEISRITGRPLWDGPMFSSKELDHVEAFLATLDLSLTPE